MSNNKGKDLYYQDLASSISSELYKEIPAWLTSFREDSVAKFSTDGFPSLADEQWRYTNIAQIEKSQFKLVTEPASLQLADIQQYFLEGCDQLVFVDGFYQQQLSSLSELPANTLVMPISEALAEQADLIEPYFGQSIKANADIHTPEGHGFKYFNSALFSDGVFVYLPKNAALAKPLQLVFIGAQDSALINTRNVIVAKAGSKAVITETYHGLTDQAYLTNAITEVHVESNASLSHNRLQTETEQAFHIGGVYSALDANAIYKQASYQFGAKLARVEVHADLGTASDCELNGLYIGHGEQVLDNHTRLNHRMPHAISKEFYKGIMDDKSRGIFQGCIIVAEQAQKTDADMGNRNLLLSNKAEIDAKPQLEIYADDVKCAHGVTIGQLDEESVFYLRTRGADEQSARNMLTFAFANEMVERIELAPLKSRVLDELLQRFPQQGMKKEWL